MRKTSNLILCACALALSACTSALDSSPAPNKSEDAVARALRLFQSDAVTVSPDLVPCVLSGGTQTRCLRITVKDSPGEVAMGPWCPRNIADGPDVSGIWLDGGKVHAADGAFVRNLSAFYDDPTWQLYDPETGAVHVTDTKAACLAAARPDVDARYNNYCVECQPSYLESTGDTTYLIPAEPVPLATPRPADPHGGVGMAFNGVKYEAPVPTHAILSAHTLAPLDRCGGHVNPHAGYHYHAVMGCEPEVASAPAHASMLGYALDGYVLYDQLDADGSQPADLDACSGHAVSGLGYHYHVNDPGKNQIIGCFKAEQGCVLEGDQQTCAAGGRPPPPPN